MDLERGVMAVDLVICDGATFLSRKAEVLAVYGAAFAAPPYRRTQGHVDDFSAALERHVRYAGFRAVHAVAAESGALQGFVYGYTGAPGQWWTDVVLAQMPPAIARRWLSEHFEFVELAVRPAAQGHGIGGRLHDTVLEGLPHRTAVLSTLHEETAGLRLYRRRGWTTLLDRFFFPNVREPYRIMGLDLEARRSLIA